MLERCAARAPPTRSGTSSVGDQPVDPLATDHPGQVALPHADQPPLLRVLLVEALRSRAGVIGVPKCSRPRRRCRITPWWTHAYAFGLSAEERRPVPHGRRGTACGCRAGGVPRGPRRGRRRRPGSRSRLCEAAGSRAAGRSRSSRAAAGADFRMRHLKKMPHRIQPRVAGLSARLPAWARPAPGRAGSRVGTRWRSSGWVPLWCWANGLYFCGGSLFSDGTNRNKCQVPRANWDCLNTCQNRRA